MPVTSNVDDYASSRTGGRASRSPSRRPITKPDPITPAVALALPQHPDPQIQNLIDRAKSDMKRARELSDAADKWLARASQLLSESDAATDATAVAKRK